MPGLVILMGPGLAMAGVLAWGIHSIPHRHATAHADHAALPARERTRRWIEIGLLYTTNAIRFTVNMMLVQLVIRWTEAWVLAHSGGEGLTDALRVKAAAINGPLQSAMSIGIAIASLLLGWFGAARLEKRLLIMVPLLGAAAIALFPLSSAVWIAFSLSIIAGVGYQGVVPITITMAQRLVPHRTSLASGLMLGGAWTVAAAGPPVAQWLCNRVGLSCAFEWVAGLLVVSVGLTIPLRSPARG
jgi:MFS family permease